MTSEVKRMVLRPRSSRLDLEESHSRSDRADRAEARLKRSAKPTKEPLKQKSSAKKAVSVKTEDTTGQVQCCDDMEQLALFLSSQAQDEPGDADASAAEEEEDPFSILLAASQMVKTESPPPASPESRSQRKLEAKIRNNRDKGMLLPGENLTVEEKALVFRKNEYLDSATVTRRKAAAREGLEETTGKVLRLLQVRGRMLINDLISGIGINYRRVYDILNVLQSTPLVNRVGPGGTKTDDKKEHNASTFSAYQLMNKETPVVIKAPVDLETGEAEAEELVGHFMEGQRAHQMITTMLMGDDDAVDVEGMATMADGVDDNPDAQNTVSQPLDVGPTPAPVSSWPTADWAASRTMTDRQTTGQLSRRRYGPYGSRRRNEG
ncbi:E2F/DP family winged-helix DNA-binding domain [Carpediemonas membranifera]|uniref:E2F/DP family winged-helix DNA-binding domain n=1 Tax=Carpediemonas membranifera TaxID=201153 RepID=A0A8J6AZL7_9EUKA|nr:E2F/DP family winged-helix DNA-binding domain [Carpediemonas membranifera]|eukprot:KAG9391099.1 E2F/DP family winged-helix DNA-binding domain [Carpediemonas membranifera]